MCRLLAFAFKETTTEEERVNTISAFQALAKTGTVPLTIEKGHYDGWGIAVYTVGVTEPKVYKSTLRADDDSRFDATALLHGGVFQSGLAHLRKKTVGDTAFVNTHPFVEGKYSFIHNGTVQKGDGPYVELSSSCGGVTDSERLFRKFLTIANEKPTLDAYLEMLLTTKERYPGFSAVNSILHDGTYMYISRFINEGYPDYVRFGLEDYYTLYLGRTSNGDIIVCSEKLPFKDIEYTLLSNNTISVINLATGEQETVEVL